MKKMDSLDIITHIYSDIDSVHNSRIHDLEILDEDENIIIIPSVNKNFVSANISVLSTMKDTSFVVFGFTAVAHIILIIAIVVTVAVFKNEEKRKYYHHDGTFKYEETAGKYEDIW